MGILLAGEAHDMFWDGFEHITNITYRGTVYDVGQHKHAIVRHPFRQEVDYAEIEGFKQKGFADWVWESYTGQEHPSIDVSMGPLAYSIDQHTSEFSIMFAKTDAVVSRVT